MTPTLGGDKQYDSNDEMNADGSAIRSDKMNANMHREYEDAHEDSDDEEVLDTNKT
jgi:hypothetical protein